MPLSIVDEKLKRDEEAKKKRRKWLAGNSSSL
jgi:hypothetical protein